MDRGGGKNNPAGGSVNEQIMFGQKIETKYRLSYICQKKRVTKTARFKLNEAVRKSPSRDAAAVGVDEDWSSCRGRRAVREDAEGGPGVDQKTTLGKFVTKEN